MRRSRLNKNFEKKAKRTMILSIIGMVIILFLLFKFGIDALVNFSMFISGSKNSGTTQNANQINYVAIPILNPLSVATNSAQIVISGGSLKDYSIVLYINNSEIDQSNTDQNGKFHFTEDLSKGSNQIAVRAKYNNKQSELSDAQSVNYTNSQPKLDVNSPSDGQHFDKNSIGTGNTIGVSGATDPEVSVTVNGLWAVIDDNNNFSYTLTLQNGDSQLKIIATDQAGNTSEKDLKVSYSQ